eukprot:sb/3474577/
MCVYHIQLTETHVQFMCADVQGNIVIVEVEIRTARENWDQISLCHGVSCLFESLALVQISPAFRLLPWFPQLQVLVKGSHFANVTLIEDARALWEKIRAEKNKEKFQKEYEEEFEDSHGNVVSRKVFNDLKRQGLL